MHIRQLFPIKRFSRGFLLSVFLLSSGFRAYAEGKQHLGAVPVAASIVEQTTISKDVTRLKIGNVKVRFSDGHSEMWTKGGQCVMPQVSSSGLVGWVRFSALNEDYAEPITSTIRVVGHDEKWQDYTVPAAPYIEDWAFTSDERFLLIASRHRHGPPYYYKFDLRSGEILDQCGPCKYDEKRPNWARTFSDDEQTTDSKTRETSWFRDNQ